MSDTTTTTTENSNKVSTPEIGYISALIKNGNSHILLKDLPVPIDKLIGTKIRAECNDSKEYGKIINVYSDEYGRAGIVFSYEKNDPYWIDFIKQYKEQQEIEELEKLVARQMSVNGVLLPEVNGHEDLKPKELIEITATRK